MPLIPVDYGGLSRVEDWEATKHAHANVESLVCALGMGEVEDEAGVEGRKGTGAVEHRGVWS